MSGAAGGGPRSVRYGVVPAGGLGTRFLPISRIVPKELLPIVDTAVIELVVGELAAAGIRDVVLVVAPGKETVAAYFQPNERMARRLATEFRADELALLRRPETLARVRAVTQPEPLGNGHAVLMARSLVGDEPFALLWGDDVMPGPDPAIGRLLAARERLGGGSVVGCMRVAPADAERYGMIAGTEVDERTRRVLGIVEKPRPADAPSDLAAVHGYVLEPEIFDVLARLRPGRGGELWLTDAIAALVREGGVVWSVELAGPRYDTGDKLGYLVASLDAMLTRPDTGPAIHEHLRRLGWKPPAGR